MRIMETKMETTTLGYMGSDRGASGAGGVI